MLKILEHSIAPYVFIFNYAYFAFANAGVKLEGASMALLLDHVTLGVLVVYLFGKQIGVFSFSLLSIKLGWAEKPANSNWMSFYGVAF